MLLNSAISFNGSCSEPNFHHHASFSEYVVTAVIHPSHLRNRQISAGTGVEPPTTTATYCTVSTIEIVVGITRCELHAVGVSIKDVVACSRYKRVLECVEGVATESTMVKYKSSCRHLPFTVHCSESGTTEPRRPKSNTLALSGENPG